MAEGQEQDDKTEDASERRIEQALERGDVPKSADLQGFLTLGAGYAALALLMPGIGVDIANRLGGMLAGAHRGIDMPTTGRALGVAGLAVAGPMLAIVVAGIAAALIMHRPMLVTEPLMPKFNRISPAGGLKRLFGKDNLVQFGKTLAKLTAVCAVLWLVLWPERARIVGLVRIESPAAALNEVGRLTGRLVVSVLILYAAIAGFDAVWSRFTWKKRLRMSLHEVKQEHKETDGNPEIKARVRSLRQQRSRRRMMAAVPSATVILVNPTHYAVALRYEKGMPAPVCVAKGVDDLALRIRTIGRENCIPVVENPPLARTLHAAVEVDETIPPEHFKAVAEVIGFVLRARRRR